jgi:PAS domain S-box-containing protein
MNLAPRLRPLALLSALSAAVTGFWALNVWRMGDWGLLSLGADYIPMAPPTAILFVILGLALAAQLRWPESRAARLSGTLGSFLALLVGGLAILQSALDLTLPWDTWMLARPASVRDIPVGRMSPLTALAFAFSALGLLAGFSRFAGFPSLRRLGHFAAGVGLAIGTVVTFGYAVGTPLLYGGQIVPMALLTGLAFLALNGALLLTGPVEGFFQRWHASDSEPHVPGEHRIFTRRLVLTLAAIGALLVVAGFVYLRREQEDARLVISRQLEAIARLKVQQIRAWRDERLGEARFLQQTPAVVRDLAALVARPEDPAARRQLLEWLAPIKSGDRYSSISVLDAQGRLLLSLSSPADFPEEHVPGELLAQVLASPDPVFGDLQRHSAGAAVHLDLLVPVRPSAASAGDGALGIIVLQLDPWQFLFPLIQHWPLPSDSAESFIVRREGDQVVFLSELRHRPGAALTLRHSISESGQPAAMAARGQTGVHTGLDYRGIPVLTVSRPVPSTPWILIAKVDQAEVYAPIQRELWQNGLILGLLLLTLGMTGVTLWRQRHAATLRRVLAAERDRQAMAERLGLVMRHANDGIFLMDEEGQILEANDRALALYGYTFAELRTLPPGGLRHPAASPELAGHLDLLESPGGAVFETMHRRKDGTVFPVEVSGRRVMLGGRPHLLGIYRDITERRHLTDELARRETQFRAVFDHAPVGISLTAHGVGLLLANAEHARITGVPVEKSTEPGIFARASHPEDYARQTELAERFVRGEIDHYTVEKRYLHPDGRVQWAELTSRFFPGPDTGEKWIVTTVTDIAERKAREQEIERLNRMYFVISQVNQTIARAKSRAELFAEICRVLVDFGRFRIAWVGWLDRASQLILPVGVAGDEHGYVTGITISADPGRPESRGPSGTAFREGRILVCNDFFGDPALQPWHERARPCGFQSSIALPLREDGAVRGLLTVYAAEKHFFGPPEISLLEEAADDLSFALGVLAGQDRRQAAESALQQAKEDFSRVFMSSPTAVCITTQATGLFLDLNEAWARLGGYRREEAVGRTTLELNVWSEAQDRDEIRRQFAAEHRIYNREIRFRRKDGTLLDTLISIEGISFGGEPCLISTIIDITREKQAQQKLTEQIAELRRWHEATLGREERILDLKREVNELRARAGTPARYPSAPPGNGAGDA